VDDSSPGDYGAEQIHAVFDSPDGWSDILGRYAETVSA